MKIVSVIEILLVDVKNLQAKTQELYEEEIGKDDGWNEEENFSGIFR